MEIIPDLNHVDFLSAGGIIAALVFAVKYQTSQLLKSNEKVMEEKNKTIERLMVEKEYLQKKEEETDSKLVDLLQVQVADLKEKINEINKNTNGTAKPMSRMVEDMQRQLDYLCKDKGRRIPVKDEEPVDITGIRYYN